MTRDELLELIAEVQQHQSELDDVEVKSAQRGTPQRLFETDNQARYTLQRMRDQGFLRLEGARRGARYVLP